MSLEREGGGDEAPRDELGAVATGTRWHHRSTLSVGTGCCVDIHHHGEPEEERIPAMGHRAMVSCSLSRAMARRPRLRRHATGRHSVRWSTTWVRIFKSRGAWRKIGNRWRG
jgi:hypothetical protein